MIDIIMPVVAGNGVNCIEISDKVVVSSMGLSVAAEIMKHNFESVFDNVGKCLQHFETEVELIVLYLCIYFSTTTK